MHTVFLKLIFMYHINYYYFIYTNYSDEEDDGEVKNIFMYCCVYTYTAEYLYTLSYT